MSAANEIPAHYPIDWAAEDDYRYPEAHYVMLRTKNGRTLWTLSEYGDSFLTQVQEVLTRMLGLVASKQMHLLEVKLDRERVKVMYDLYSGGKFVAYPIGRDQVAHAVYTFYSE